MALVNNGKKRPKIRKVVNQEVCPEEVAIVNEIEEIPTVEIEETVEIVEEVEETATETEEIVKEPTEEIIDEVEETEEVLEEVDEVPLEMSEDEMQVALDEEGSLDGTMEEVEELASQETTEEPTEETVETVEEAPVVEETVETVEEAPVVEETVEIVEEPTEETPTIEVEQTVTEPVVEETEEVVEELAARAENAPLEESEESEEDEEEKVEEKPKKDEFKLTAPANLDDILANICTKRARKLIYRPNEVVFSHTTTVLGTDKANDEKVKVKNILDAEIKQGVKLGYLDKFDGLKMSELKEEYENDVVYEFADQEFKRTGILLDGDKVKVYVYDWDLKACHHVGYIDDESANLVKPYIIDREKYSFDINGIIVGGKYKKIIKDEKTGKITVEKGNDGNLGLEIDINVIKRKD